MKDNELRPKISLRCSEEEVVETYDTFNQLKELISCDTATKNRILMSSVYARLCHVEGRILRLKHDEIIEPNTEALTRKLMSEVVEFRTKYYKEKTKRTEPGTSTDEMNY